MTVLCDRIYQRWSSKIRVDEKTGCWEWQGAKSRGYGIMSSRKGFSPYKAHRVAYELCHGEIPDGGHILHKCDNPCCCNPGHLYCGDAADNARDVEERGRRNPESLLNLRPGASGCHGAGPLSKREISHGK